MVLLRQLGLPAGDPRALRSCALFLDEGLLYSAASVLHLLDVAGPGVAAPVGIPESFEEHIGVMFDLLAIAYQADLTRIFTFMTGREASQRWLIPARIDGH